MLILALNTTSEIGGVGIFRDTQCLASVPNEGAADGYSIALFEMLEQALRRAHLELREIDLYAAANGPGSFTGIRVGLAAARAWGKAFDRRVRGVSVLEAMVNAAHPASDWAFPIVDARRGEFFVSAFRPSPSKVTNPTRRDYQPADGGWILKPDTLRAFLEERLTKGESATCLVRATDQAAADLRASMPASLIWQQVDGPLLDAIADIARNEEQSSRPCPETSLDAYYIRRPDAEVNWKN